jgi:UDP-glucose 4-epimerase
MRVVVTGGAGFIGSNLTDALVAAGHRVLVLDNFTTGFRRHLEGAEAAGCEIVECDCYLEPQRLPELVAGAEAIVHLAANADVRFGWDHTRRDLEQNVIATHNVLEAARLAGVKRLVFSSTGSVYGECAVVPTPENAPFPVQTSLYGASKTAAEGYIAAYAEAGQIAATVFRFVSLLGPRYSHGHVIDFVHQLQKHPDHLHILGDGTQRKSYLHVSDCVGAMAAALERDPSFEVLNLGLDEFCTVNDSAGWICGSLGLEPAISYSGGDRGWVGDNPFIYLDTARVRATGWVPKFAIRDAVENTVEYLLANLWLLEETADAVSWPGPREEPS